eukprot:scaffold658755_cov59-Prasinocladus_malaysianus.AAC.1
MVVIATICVAVYYLGVVVVFAVFFVIVSILSIVVVICIDGSGCQDVPATLISTTTAGSTVAVDDNDITSRLPYFVNINGIVLGPMYQTGS